MVQITEREATNGCNPFKSISEGFSSCAAALKSETAIITIYKVAILVFIGLACLTATGGLAFAGALVAVGLSTFLAKLGIILTFIALHVAHDALFEGRSIC